MSDDTVFDLLHSEIVNYLVQPTDKENTNEKVQKNNSKLQYLIRFRVFRDVDLTKLESLGFSMGYRVIERLTKDWPRFKEELDIMKFLCTDFWSAVYKKQIDNLRTNHQGTYVLQDNEFRFLTKMSGGKQYLEVAPRYATFTCGVIRGVLSNLGLNCIVTAEIHSMPTCKFHIQVNRNVVARNI